MKPSLLSITRTVLFFLISFCLQANAMNIACRRDFAFEYEYGIAQATSSSKCGRLEDRYIIDIDPELPFFAIFDGHHGTKAAEYAQLYLSKYVRQECINKNTQDFCDATISRAFANVNSEILNIKNDDSGSTVVSIFLSIADDNDDLIMHVAHIGDSGGVLVTQDWYRSLTCAHRPQNIKELERIKNFALTSRKRTLHDTERRSSNDLLRLKTKCNATRKLMFGEDIDTEIYIPRPQKHDSLIAELGMLPKASALKVMQDTLWEAQANEFYTWESKTGLSVTRCFGHQNLIDQGLICEPDISHVRIKEKEGFFLLFSDGVGDHLRDEDAAKLLIQGLSEKKTLNEIANNLLIEAASNDSKNLRSRFDNQDLIRGIRDDMTVIIVKFNRL